MSNGSITIRKKSVSAWTFTKDIQTRSSVFSSDTETPTLNVSNIPKLPNDSECHLGFHRKKRLRKENWTEGTKLYTKNQAKKPEDILKSSSAFLTSYEKSEIEGYSEIYFAGSSSNKLESNYQDEEGYYRYVIGDHIAYRYEVLAALGKGTFSEVFDCMDHKSGERFAVKIIRSQKSYKEMGEYECKILNLIKTSKNPYKGVNMILDSFEFRGHICLVLEKLRENLLDFQDHFINRKVPVDLARSITGQIVRSMSFIHNLGLIHCDLKPDNVMFRHGNLNEIEIIDFNSSCENNRRVLDYIQSRPYRAPEIVLEFDYSVKIDMWSLGCIVVEILTGERLFRAESEAGLFRDYIEVLGYPNKRLIAKSRRCNMYMDRTGKYKVKAQPKVRSIEKVLEGFDLKVIDFVGKLLVWDQGGRMSALEAMNHEWIRDIIV